MTISPGRQNVGPVGNIQRHGDVLFDQQNGQPAFSQPRDQIENVVDHLRRQAERRLVEQQQPGPGHQRPSNRKLLLLAARQGAGQLPAPFRENREQFEHLLPGGCGGGPVAARRGAERQVLVDGKRREHAAAFRHQRHAGADDQFRPQPAHCPAVERDRARVGRDQADDGAERRGLAGAVGAEQGHDLSRIDRQTDIPDGQDRPVTNAQAGNGKQHQDATAYAVSGSARDPDSAGRPVRACRRPP